MSTRKATHYHRRFWSSHRPQGNRVQGNYEMRLHDAALQLIRHNVRRFPRPTMHDIENHDSDPHSDPDQPRPHSGLSKGAIAGIALGTSAFTALLGIGLFFCLRARHRRKFVDSEVPPDKDAVSNDPVADLAAEMRLVRTQMERLAAQQALQGGADGTEISVTRSLSTMKHEQTRVLREMSTTATNSVEHTESGLRLTAGSVYHDDGSPPGYVPE
ncbi:hypothetical protein DFH06DRAFT_1346636 [Mycena polygramma]|nr:hypothetical protein DFH06DRAFT_1346636 [Mycena polygramma]